MSNWDTALQWGISPALASPVSAGASSLSVSGLGSGTLPAGATFCLATAPYTLAADCAIASGSATLQLTSPVLSSATATAPLTDFNALCTDNDLSDQDSSMPQMGKAITNPTSGRNAYQGKRALAKRDIAARMLRLGYPVEGIVTPSQFNRAAVFLELSYIYTDVARRNEEIPAAKAQAFYQQYAEEIEGLKFDYVRPATPDTAVRPVIYSWRA